MLSKTKLYFYTISFIFSFSLSAQKVENYDGNLVEYLTEINLNLETKVITEYCDCSQKKDFINAYQETAKAFNKTINNYISELTTLKSKKAIEKFRELNGNYNLRVDNSIKNASKKLEIFRDFSCDDKALLPATIAISEITGIANSIIGLINEGKKRRDTQRDKLVAILETFKVPSIQSYKCEKEKKEEEPQK